MNMFTHIHMCHNDHFHGSSMNNEHVHGSSMNTNITTVCKTQHIPLLYKKKSLYKNMKIPLMIKLSSKLIKLFLFNISLYNYEHYYKI